MLRALLAALLLAAPAAEAGTLRIANDLGGYVDERLGHVARLKADRTPVAILGDCASACTLYLTLPTTCIGPNARLGFHAPRSDDALGGLPLAQMKAAQALMATHYPPAVAKWFLDGPAWDMDGITWMAASTANTLGVPAC